MIQAERLITAKHGVESMESLQAKTLVLQAQNNLENLVLLCAIRKALGVQL